VFERRRLVACVLGAAALITLIAVVRHSRTTSVPPSVYPWPIGPTADYRPTPVNDAVAAGVSLGSLRCGNSATFDIHVELFAHRQVIVVPAGIGVSRLGCRYPLRTEVPTGVVQVESSSPHRLRDLFTIWGRSLSRTQLLTFGGHVRVFVAGREFDGEPGAVPLTKHAQIVVEVGGYVPPHTTYLFPRAS
jgi:hypothetical protein